MAVTLSNEVAAAEQIGVGGGGNAGDITPVTELAVLCGNATCKGVGGRGKGGDSEATGVGGDGKVSAVA